MSLRQQPIQVRVGERRVADPAVPVLDRQLMGDHSTCYANRVLNRAKRNTFLSNFSRWAFLWASDASRADRSTFET
jgi:predicted glycosyl hydrolase (DUF1957 family)